jgi:hypothetical protein
MVYIYLLELCAAVAAAEHLVLPSALAATLVLLAPWCDGVEERAAHNCEGLEHCAELHCSAGMAGF